MKTFGRIFFISVMVSSCAFCRDMTGALVRAGSQWGVIIFSEDDMLTVRTAGGKTEKWEWQAIKETPFFEDTPLFVISQQALFQFSECASGDALDYVLLRQNDYRSKLLYTINKMEVELKKNIKSITFSHGSTERSRQEYDLICHFLTDLPFDEILQTEDLFFALSVWFHTIHFLEKYPLSDSEARQDFIKIWEKRLLPLREKISKRYNSWGAEKEFMKIYPSAKGLWNDRIPQNNSELLQLFKESYRSFLELDNYSASLEFEKWGKCVLNTLFLSGINKENHFLTAEYMKNLQKRSRY